MKHLRVWLMVFGCAVLSDAAAADGVICLSNEVLQLCIAQDGGHFVTLERSGVPVNPLSWTMTKETMPKEAHTDAVFRGHFLCMGRAGNPSPGEMAAGVPMRGEQTGRRWAVAQQSAQRVDMSCDAPLDAMTVRRTVSLDPVQPQFLVTEQFENTFSLGRVHNVLQHVTIGPPFLSPATLVNTNAKEGFPVRFCYPDPARCEAVFPVVKLDDSGEREADLRRTSDPVNYLSSHIFSPDETYGWITAYDPVTGLVLGYVWMLSDYPWVNIWQQWKEGVLTAKGLEFGTTGVTVSYRELLETDTTFHGVRSWEYIDAGQVIEKSFLGFLVQIEPNGENPQLTVQEEQILLNGCAILSNGLSNR